MYLLRTLIISLLTFTIAMALAACGNDEPPPSAGVSPTAAAAPTDPPAASTAVTATATVPPPTAVPAEPTAAAQPTATTALPTAAPTQPAASPTMPSPQAGDDAANAALVEYAAEHAGGPGAIFVGDATQLIGLPPHEGLMFQVPEAQYGQASAASLFGVPQAGIPGHMFIFTSDYYQGLMEKARLTQPTELTSTGETIEIHHVCIDRNLPTCVLIQTYFAPNLAERTNGQVKLSVSSFAELGLAGPNTLRQVGDGSLDMVNIYTGYVSGDQPALEVQSLWGMAADWETSYLMLTDLAPDVDRMLFDLSGGSPVLNRNWFAGSDQWFFSKEPLASMEDFEGKRIRTHAASMSDFIRGMGGQPVELSVSELYISMQIGTVDALVTTLLLGITGRLFEVSDYIAGPIIGFGYTNNVINKDVWDRIPEDLQQIMIEEGAKTELEALRLAPFQNLIALQISQQVGLEARPFTEETAAHIQTVVLPEHVIPGWLRRLGYPGSGDEAVAIYNEKSAPYTGLAIAPDGSIQQVPITKGPRAQ